MVGSATATTTATATATATEGSATAGGSATATEDSVTATESSVTATESSVTATESSVMATEDLEPGVTMVSDDSATILVDGSVVAGGSEKTVGEGPVAGVKWASVEARPLNERR